MNLNIRGKIVLISAAILFLGIGANTLVNGIVFTREYSRALQSKAFVIGETLKFQLDRLLRLKIPIENLVGFEEQCQDLLTRYKDISYAMVVDLDGTILFHNDPSNHGRVSSNPAIIKGIKSQKDVLQAYFNEGEQFYDVIIPVLGPQDEYIAAVRIGFPAKLISKKTGGMVAYSIVVALVFLTLAMILLVIPLNVWVTRPLGRLITLIHDIRQKGAGAAQLIEIDSKDEMGQLGSAFNQMIFELRESQKTIENYTEELEVKVEGRTAELKAANEQSEFELTERKRAQKALRKSEEYFRSLIENALDGVMVVDGKGTINYQSPSIARILGYKPEEVVGKRISEFIYSEDESYVMEAFNPVIQNPCSTQSLQLRVQHKDGSLRIIEGIANNLLDNPYIKGIVINYRDITEGKRAEEALRKSEERYRTILDSVEEGYFEVDLTGRFTFFNEGLLKISGIPRDELLGKENREYMTPESSKKIYKLFNRTYKTGKPAQKVEHEIITNNGHRRVHELSAFLIRGQEGQPIGFRGVVRDVTERKQAEEEMKRAKEEAELANRAKSEFLANMSHEIRTPMNSVIGFTNLLLDTNLDEDQIDYASTIKGGSEALLALINDILDFSKVEAGQLDFEEIAFDPEILAYDICDLIRPRIGSKPIEILCHISDSLPSQVTGDPTRFRQVLTNLMGNASKFTETGEVELCLDIEEEKQSQLKLHATVRDTGIGIPKEKLSTIFEPFQQVDGSSTRRYGGTGLGLSICKQIAKLMHGDVWAESPRDVRLEESAKLKNNPQSKGGPGSTFHFTAWVGKAEEKKSRRLTPASLSEKKALVVDDNQRNLALLTHLLGSVGMRVVALRNGKEVVPTLQKALEADTPFDICISDIHMPGMSGYEVAKQIRNPKSQIPNLPLVALSSLMDRDAKKCEEAGFDGFLGKPIHRGKLYQMLETIMGEREGERDKAAKQRIMTQYSVKEQMKRSVRILLAEDNPVNQKLAKIMLTKAGYHVEMANNGKEAVERYMASAEDFDLIFMDIQMPEMDGMEATEEIRKFETGSLKREPGDMVQQSSIHRVPIVAMTAHAMKGDRERCLEAGMDDYIAKPIKREVVYEMINKWALGGQEAL